jgi:hypothetical protein
MSLGFNGSSVSAPGGDVWYSGTMSNFTFGTQTPMVSGKTVTAQVLKNNVATNIACTISAVGATSCTDSAHTVTFNAGDSIMVVVTASNFTTNNDYWNAQFG